MTTNIFLLSFNNPIQRQCNSSLFFLVMKDWSVSAPFSHLADSMMYDDGKLTVSNTGRYYIYLQVYCITQGRVYVRANNRVITIIQSPTSWGTLYEGGVFNLTAGDVITFLSAYANFQVFMYRYHTYFGAICFVAKSSFFMNNTFLLQTAVFKKPITKASNARFSRRQF